MRDHRSLRGFGSGLAVGVLIGLVLGSASLATAAFGYKGWQTFSTDFKMGYVTGFIGMANLARNLDPGGWVDERYPQFSKATETEWVALVDELYKAPENQQYSILSILQSAAHRLELKYGKPATADERSRQRMAHQLEIVRKQREKAGLKPEGGDPKVAAEPTKEQAEALQKALAEQSKRKWCRCDGTDPKEARARRQEAAAAPKTGNSSTATKTGEATAVKKPGNSSTATKSGEATPVSKQPPAVTKTPAPAPASK